ncbi:neurexin-2-alpha [Plakobranchus ocellatus]|uniref:Neurexin-2-alpha n=1 Tax=Plakobranchus ocellatus TaxID=259542 RepID=A0AAV3YJQ2_9GAST|nr:neurexin-2-alpha [Plakobranchus ocellatus]
MSRDVRFADAAFDELQMWDADRDYLSAHAYIQRSRPQHFLVPFEELINRDQLNHPVLSIRLVDGPQLVPGKVNNALRLRGRGQYADLGRQSTDCLSNLQACTQGITVAAWMRFRRFENNMVFLSTGENGILMMYRDGYIQVSVDGRGIISLPRFDFGRWYFVELSWHPESGLRVYVDNELKGETSKDYVAPSSERSTFRIGHPNQGDVNTRYATGEFDIDELEIWYGKREDLLAFNFISRGEFDIDELEIWYGKREDLLAFNFISRDDQGYEVFSFDRVDGQRVLHDKYDVQLMNGAAIVRGRLGGAVYMDGRRQYVNLGRHYDKCLGNIDLCRHGMTLSVHLRPGDLRRDQTFLAAPTFRLYYESGMLKAEFMGENRTWRTESSGLREGSWQRVTLAWHQMKGLSMYIDDELASRDDRGFPVRGGREEPETGVFYVGRSLQSDRETATGLVDELQVWYDDLEQLRETGRYTAQVVPYTIRFDDFRADRGEFNVRDKVIRGVGQYQVIQGKGQNMRGIYLFGTTGYIDLGQNFICGGDLRTCRQGATLRLGLRPDNIREDAVYLDSFPVRLWYRDGRLYARLQTEEEIWQVDTSEFRPGTWQRVELTWHPRRGLVMYINGRRVGNQVYSTRRSSPESPTNFNTYIGRSLEDGGSNAKIAVDSIQLWTAYRDEVPEDSYLRIRPYLPPTPRPNPGPRTTPLPKDFQAISSLSYEDLKAVSSHKARTFPSAGQTLDHGLLSKPRTAPFILALLCTSRNDSARE